ncbi:MAG TPA: PEGA domain-containing protein [Polyangiaceae bacterium]|nr:PEGA domain-containing protein [Polyangiaceae bacterium]
MLRATLRSPANRIVPSRSALSRPGLNALVVLTALLTARHGSAQASVSSASANGTPAAANAEAPNPSDPSAREPDPARRNAAIEHFRRGLELARKGNCSAALPEFLISRELSPLVPALINAAICLQDLGRPAEALDLYDEIEKSYSNVLTPNQRLQVTSAVQVLAGLVGELEIRVVQPGASISVDSQVRGVSPLARVVRVNGGSHQLRVVKDGYESYQVDAVVSSGERRILEVNLTPAQPESTHSPAPAAPAAPALPIPEPVTPIREQTPPPLTFGLFLGPTVAPSFGGEADASCSKDVISSSGEARPGCSSSPLALGGLVGGRIAYRLSQGVAADFSGGYLGISRRLTRVIEATAADGSAYLGRAVRDERKLRGWFTMLGMSKTLGTRTPLLLRLGAGVARMRLDAHVSGEFTSADTAQSGAFELDEDPRRIWIPFINPELRFGYRVAPKWVLDAGISLWWGFPPSVSRTGDVWNFDTRRAFTQLDSGASEELTLRKESALGMMLIVVPTIGAQFDL